MEDATVGYHRIHRRVHAGKLYNGRTTTSSSTNNNNDHNIRRRHENHQKIEEFVFPSCFLVNHDTDSKADNKRKRRALHALKNQREKWKEFELWKIYLNEIDLCRWDYKWQMWQHFCHQSISPWSGGDGVEMTKTHLGLGNGTNLYINKMTELKLLPTAPCHDQRPVLHAYNDVAMNLVASNCTIP